MPESVRSESAAASASHLSSAAAAGVALRALVNNRDGILTGKRLRELIPDWKSASVWFCGPAAFGQMLRKDLVDAGLAADNFHQELFNLR